MCLRPICTDWWILPVLICPSRRDFVNSVCNGPPQLCRVAFSAVRPVVVLWPLHRWFVIWPIQLARLIMPALICPLRVARFALLYIVGHCIDTEIVVSMISTTFLGSFLRRRTYWCIPSCSTCSTCPAWLTHSIWWLISFNWPIKGPITLDLWQQWVIIGSRHCNHWQIVP